MLTQTDRQVVNPFPNDKFYSSKLKGFADVIFKVNGNGRKFFKWVGNTAGKGEIACYKPFLLFPHSVFKRLVLQTHDNKGLFRKGLTMKREAYTTKEVTVHVHVN